MSEEIWCRVCGVSSPDNYKTEHQLKKHIRNKHSIDELINFCIDPGI